LVERLVAGSALKPSTGNLFLWSSGACEGLRRWEVRRCCDVLAEGVTIFGEETFAEAEAVLVVEERESPSAIEEEVIVIVEELAGATTVAPEAPDNEEIAAESASKVPEAQNTENISPKAVAEAPDATIAEVNAAEVAPKVEAKGVLAPATEEAKLEVKEPELLIVVDAGSAAPEEEPTVDEAKLAGTTTNVEGRVEDHVSGQTVAMTAGTVVVTAVAQLFGTFLSAEWSRLAMLVWLGGWVAGG
jgi:hypothetical protein